MSSSRRIGLTLVAAALLSGCGGNSGALGDGQWFGKLVSVDVSNRRLEFAPVCRLMRAGRWTAQRGHAAFAVGLAAHPSLEIYYRPGGKVSAGHAQYADLGRLARIAAGGRLPDFPPGWFIAVRGGRVAAVAEDSGLREFSPAVKRKLACVLSAARRFSTLQKHK